jgi:hypothetical protein
MDYYRGSKTIAAEAGYTWPVAINPVSQVLKTIRSCPRMNIGYEDTLPDFEFKIYTAQSAAQFFNPRIRKVKSILCY